MINSGKAKSLSKLQTAGFRVPKFFVCDSSWSEQRIQTQINMDLPNAKFFAVRSSAFVEDSIKQSFAGHFYSGLGISKSDVFNEVKKVRNSFGEISGQIIIQEFIPTEISGVMFTEIDNKSVLINSTLGLCQSVVNGYACDEYLFSPSGQLITKSIGKNKVIQLFLNKKITKKVSNEPSLTEKQGIALVKVGQKIQRLFNSKQDIEWGFYKQKLYILQSRPITKDFKVKNLQHFDSANISESYSGIVLPLTQSFAKMVYRQVYRDLLRHSGVSISNLNKYPEIFDNLLGFFYGRMYYNMNNWYLMAAFVPGYKRNKQNFESMITSNIKEIIITKIKPSIIFSLTYPLIVLFKAFIYGFTVNYFKSIVNKEITSLYSKDLSQLKYEECIKLFWNLNNRLLRRWYIAVENDFFVMTYLGILKKFLPDTYLQKQIKFPSKSTEQVKALSTLSKKMAIEKKLWKAVKDNNGELFNKELSKNPHLNSLYTEYLQTFGGRFANELKLESVGIDEDTTKLFTVLKVYRNYKTPEINAIKEKMNLPFLKFFFVSIILNKFKQHAKLREEFRLLRSNTFGISRRLFRQMGKILVKKGIIENIEDIFYLNLEEILNPPSDKKMYLNNFKKTLPEQIKERREEYKSYQSISPPSYFSTLGNLPPSIKNKKKDSGTLIQANPASPGVVRGKVRIFKEFKMPGKINFDILVTSHTDPGWTSLIALSKGIIIEYGGVLSHASIVARELNIPAVIGASDIMITLKNNQIVEIDGSTGTIRKVN